MSFYQNVTPSVLLEGNSSLDVEITQQPKTWFSSGRAPARRGRGGRKVNRGRHRPMTTNYPSRPITVNNASNMPIATGARRRKVVTRPPHFSSQHRPNTTAAILNQRAQYPSRKSQHTRQAQHVGKREVNASPRFFIKTGAREKRVAGVQHPFRSSQIALLLKLKELLSKNEMDKEKCLQVCICALHELQNDASTGVSEIMDIVIPHLVNAMYRNSSSKRIKIPMLDDLFDNRTDEESVYSRSIPFYKILEDLEDRHEQSTSREDSFESKLKIHRQAQNDMRVEIKALKKDILATKNKLEAEQLAHQDTRIKLEKFRVQQMKSTEQNINLLNMLHNSEAHRHSFEKESKKLQRSLRQDLIAAKENSEAYGQAVLGLQQEIERLKLPEESRSEVGRIKKELSVTKNTLAMQRGQYLALVEKFNSMSNTERGSSDRTMDKKIVPRSNYWDEQRRQFWQHDKDSSVDSRWQCHLVEHATNLHQLHLGVSFCERVFSKMLRASDCATFLLGAYNAFKKQHFDSLEMGKLINEIELYTLNSDEDDSDYAEDGEKSRHNYQSARNDDAPMSIKILSNRTTFMSFLPSYTKYESRWTTQQNAMIKTASLCTPKEKRRRHDLLPFLFIQNVRESIARYRFYSHQFTLFHNVLAGTIHVGCIHDQELMMMALKERLLALDKNKTGFVDGNSFKATVRNFLTKSLRDEDLSILNDAIDEDLVEGGKYPYGSIFNFEQHNTEGDPLASFQHNNKFAKELKLLHLYSSIYYKNCFIERVLALKGIDGKVDPSEMRRAMKLIDPRRREESIDNIIGLIMQYQDYMDTKNENPGKSKRGKSGGSDLDRLRAQAAAFAAARDRSKRVPCGDVIDALDHFFIHEWMWWF